MTETAQDAEIALSQAVPGLENALRAAATRAMMPAMSAVLALGFFQVTVSLARTIRQYRKAAGMPIGWPTALVLLLGSVQQSAQARVSDPALNEKQALRLLRTTYSLSQAVLLALPPVEKVKAAANPFARTKATPAPSPLPDVRKPSEPDARKAMDMTPTREEAMREAAIDAALAKVSGRAPHANFKAAA